ncbi:hypothetical protein DSLPV1_145 [Dishui lake phycodnavirus 1]|uniref:hypothetical protein n=1 Tax=Dishui lake phycodnavirus 1 TaxID=2079134 RepID=UPI000CD6AA3A|nr:hypothetical protein C5Y57_gp145 [Dishui lake phycodnavirus 1]AUT19116.1 hypothetical protein DSLPV1_145 [Dishui lake phycodnavirus 1]
MNPALIGGLVLLIVIVVAVVMMMSGDSGASAPTQAPTQDISQATDASTMAAGATGGDEGDEASQSAAAAMEPKEGESGEAQAVEVPDDAPSTEPDKVSGLVGWFTGDSWDEDNNVWKDKSGQGNDITEVKGTPIVFDAEDEVPQKYLYGGKEDGFRIPQACLTRGKKYTFFHVARYGSQNKADQHRIFDGIDGNNLSGFHNQHVAMAHRDGSGAIGHWWTEDHWNSYFYGKSADDPAKFMVQVDQKRNFRTDGLPRTGYSGGREIVTSQMTVNYGQALAGQWGGPNGERSVWNIGEMIFFNRELTEDEIFKVENYLFKRWKIPRKVYMQGHWPHNNWNKEDGWSNDDPWGGLNNTGVGCGGDGVMTFYRPVNRHHYWDSGANMHKPNGHFYPEAACTVNIHDGQDQNLQEKKGPIVNIRDTTTTNRQKYEKLFNIDCGKFGINSYRFEKVGEDNMRVVYKCHNQPTVSQSCTDAHYHTHGRAVPTSENVYEALDLQELHCGAKAMTKVQAYTREDGGFSVKAKCCALEDLE